ncbi:MAG: tetratricopeptide repeat protein [Polyangiaceae bacterium]|nr:tetratricopeptide repeat protein [Polyangiaceae bacterium]
MAVDREKVAQTAQKFVEKKRFDKAVEEYQKILAEDPRDVRTLLKVGDLRLKAEQYPDAITTYETVGQFYLQQKALPKALAVYKQIREIIRKHVPHLEDRFGHVVPKLAEIYAQLGYMGDALATYDELAARLASAGRERDVIDVFRKVTDLDPSNPIPLLRLADAYMRVRDIDSAIEKLGEAAQSLLKLGRREEALKVVERLLQHRQEPRFCRLAAEIYLDRAGPNDGLSALTRLQVAFKDNPRDLETLALLARAFDVAAQPTRAVEVLKEAARIAKEAGKIDVFSSLVDTLQQRAPKDDGVRALVALRSAGSKASHPPSQASIAPPPSSVLPPPAAPPPPVVTEKPRLTAAQEARINAADPRASIDVELDEYDSEPISISVESKPFALKNTPTAALSDPALRTRMLLSQAEQLRRDRNYEEAVAVLEGGIDSLPDARELREKLCDLLLEAGDQTRAIVEMLAFARRLAETEDVEGAARVLDEVLLLEPTHAEAMALLGELGYAVPGIEAAPAEPSYDPNAPLPSYDLDDLSQPGREQSPAFDGLDDPFGGDMPLPSFPIDDESAAPYPPASVRPSYEPPQYPNFGTGGYAAAPPIASGAYPPVDFEQEAFTVEARTVEQPPQVHIPRPPAYTPSQSWSDQPPPPVSTGQFDEAALEEVDFFVSQGMLDDARTLLDEQLSRLPNHPLLLDRKRELDTLVGGAPNESGARIAPRSIIPAPQLEDRAFDIAASLDALDALDTHKEGFDQQQVSVESVFEQFKEGVKAQVSESDAATHYDLGVAYREMGLFTDAISEFEIASRDPVRECVCQSMIGMLHLQLGNMDAGIDALIRALHAAQKTREQETALYYEIATSYEHAGNKDQALQYFHRLQRVDKNYFDPRGTVQERIRLLEGPKPKPAVAVGQDIVTDDFDAAFDELLGGKLP